MSEELSRSEQLFRVLAGGSLPANFVPQSRLEELLLAYIKGEKPNHVPQSRLEALLCACCNSSQGGTIVDAVLAETTITENGTHTPPTGVDGFSKVEVNVPIPEVEKPILEPLTVTENGAYTPSAGVDGFSEVVVDVMTGGGIPGPITAIAAGSITPTSDITEFTLPHNLGVVPKIVIVCLDNVYRADDNGGAIFSYMVNYMVAVGDGLDNKNTQALIQYIHPTSFNKLSMTSNGNTITETTAEIKGGSDTAMFKATVIDENGETIPAVYNWVAMAF